MTKRKLPKSSAKELRSRAVKLMGLRPPAPPPSETSVNAIDRCREELNIHRLELELQNEELRHARADLEAGLDRYTQLFDFASIGYATINAEGTIREMNHVGAGILYDSRARLIGKHFGQFISTAERSLFTELIVNVLRTDRKETHDFELVRFGNERPSVRVTAVSLIGHPPTILLAFEDVTAQKRAEERLLRADAALRDADRRKDEFLAILSHELRTPLSTLLMYGQLLRQGVVEEERVRSAAEAIEKAARVQARLIDDLLDISRIVAGKLNMQVDAVDIAVPARAALDAITQDAERNDLELVVTIEPDLPTIFGDAARLQQAIVNLLVNAIKFTAPGGKIGLTIKRVDPCLVIEVADTGAGIDAAFLPRIFERFSQADRTPTRNAGGLGLGLSIARSIVEAHNGSIRAKSAGLNKGASFTVSLPVGLAPRTSALAPGPLPTTATASKIKGKRLLVVEDDDSTRQILTEVLTFAGAEVRGAQGSEAAMRILSDFCPDVLVCDIAMPDEDGCALLRRIRARGPQMARKIRAVALTAFAGDEHRVRTRAAGFETHLVKPIDIQQLINAVSNLLPPEGSPSASSAN